MNWKPSAPISNLSRRAAILDQIRRFFKNRGLLEVETPSMSHFTVTDVHLSSFQTYFTKSGISTKTVPLYLITSPEYHMKRLLAAGSGPIFQICHSFRNEEIGRYHNPEFTILEWYRLNYDIHCLMNEVNDLLQNILDCNGREMFTYQQIFINHVGFDPLSANKKQLYDAAVKLNLFEEEEKAYLIEKQEDRDTLVQLLFTIQVRPNIGLKKPTFIYLFPISQSALAEVNVEDCRVVDRFEVYFRGIELANGFRELIDVNEHRQRFAQDNRKREKMQLNKQSVDKNFLAALTHGMPACSGVALGIDRLIMMVLNTNCLNDVIAFSVERA
ncbi:elongation factor P--(R)-beta-lysine ligase [Sodalis sp. CWE]|uniref:elongation factor P--(R)-beta-lysine ligase n=1 Tax=Sodalis sp. CWE TaxID=2803816 RepID=UPI001C7D50DC|nr:elongation factor P--(R)-beta-lysine ligase [Sodalis sp. CWE]MBX4180814.1 elongation factor P--(R)-beta-lysine ligase [Sodalis sp. CWE]